MAHKLREIVTKTKSAGTQSGFTLVELLVVIVILGIVSGALATAFVVTGKTAATTTQRFSESHDAQVASAYLGTDVQSSAALTNDACYPDSLTKLISFSVDRAYSIATYYYGTSGGETKLVRRFCDGAGNLTADSTLVSFAGTAPILTCSGVGGCDPVTNPRPNTVKIAISESDGYSFKLSGSRRVYAADVTPGSPSGFPTVLALGAGGLQLVTTGNGVLHVNGGIIVNSNAQPAVTLSGNGDLEYEYLEIFGPGTCSGCPTPPGYTGRANRVPDPLANLPMPDEAGQPVYTDGNPNHGPGVYRGTALTFPNGPINLVGGVYIVESGFAFAGKPDITGTGVLLFNGCGRNAPGSCQNTGSFNVAGQVDLNVTAVTTGDYAGIVFWQPRLNTSAISITGQGSVSFQTVVYAPTASSIVLGAGNGDFLAIGSVIGNNISVTGNGVVNIG